MDDTTRQWRVDEHWKVAAGIMELTNTPEQLWNKACEYFKWTDDNPIIDKRTLTAGKSSGTTVNVEFRRPYTIKAFCLHAGISERYLEDIKNSNDKNSEWYMVLEKIMMIIYTNVLEGALVDIYNPIMASKMLNMDKEADTGNNVVKIEFVNATGKELANSENEVLKNLDFGKVEMLKDKSENFERQIPEDKNQHLHPDANGTPPDFHS